MAFNMRCAAGEGDPKQGWPNKASSAAEHLRHVFHRMGLDVSLPVSQAPVQLLTA